MEFEMLPVEIIERVVCYLDFQSVSAMSMVSTRYRDIIAKGYVDFLDVIKTGNISTTKYTKIGFGLYKFLKELLHLSMLKDLLNNSFFITKDTKNTVGDLFIQDVLNLRIEDKEFLFTRPGKKISFDVVLLDIPTNIPTNDIKKIYIFHGDIDIVDDFILTAMFVYKPDETKYLSITSYKMPTYEYISYSATIYETFYKPSIMKRYQQKKGILSIDHQ